MRAEKLDRLLAYYGDDADECGAILSNSSRWSSATIRPARAPGKRRKEIMIRTLANRPFLAAARGPVLFVVEDAHWIDPSTSELLREMVVRIHLARILVMVAHRPEWSADWASDVAGQGAYDWAVDEAAGS